MNVDDGVRCCMAGTLAIFTEGHVGLLVKSYTPNSWETALLERLHPVRLLSLLWADVPLKGNCRPYVLLVTQRITGMR